VAGFFTGSGFSRRTTLYLEETRAWLWAGGGPFQKAGDAVSFEADRLERLLEELKNGFQARPGERVTVILAPELVLEKAVFLPFRQARQVALVLPEELAAVLPDSLEEYRYGFLAPPDDPFPVTAFLAREADLSRIAAALQPGRPRFVTLEPVLASLKAAGRDQVILLIRGGRSHRLALFQKGRFAMGRSFRSGPAEFEERLREERELLLRSARLPETVESVEFNPARELDPDRAGRTRAFPLLPGGGGQNRDRRLAGGLAMTAALLVLAALTIFSTQARRRAEADYRRVDNELRRQKTLAAGADANFSQLMADETAARLVRSDLSPLESFNRFTVAVPENLPLTLEYLEIDRTRVLVNAALPEAGQLDRLVKALTRSGDFVNPVLGELKVDKGLVRFPLTLGLKEAGPGR